MNRVLFVSYDLVHPGQNYQRLLGLIKSYQSWARLGGSAYLILTDASPVQVRDYLTTALDENDKLFVGAAPTPSAWRGQSSHKSLELGRTASRPELVSRHRPQIVALPIRWGVSERHNVSLEDPPETLDVAEHPDPAPFAHDPSAAAESPQDGRLYVEAREQHAQDGSGSTIARSPVRSGVGFYQLAGL